jgi:hypothetical protein
MSAGADHRARHSRWGIETQVLARLLPAAIVAALATRRPLADQTTYLR